MGAVSSVGLLVGIFRVLFGCPNANRHGDSVLPNAVDAGTLKLRPTRSGSPGSDAVGSAVLGAFFSPASTSFGPIRPATANVSR